MFIIDQPRSRRMVHRTATLTAAAAVSLSVLSGCGSTDGSETSSDSPGVASLQSPATATATSTSSAAPERPLIRQDASEEEKTRLRDVYIDCLWQNGLPRQAAMKGRNGGYPSDFETFDLGPGVADKLTKACGAKKPELPLQRAKRLDPDYADHLRATVQCLNDHGIEAVVQDGGPALVHGLPSESKSHWLDDCEREAFAEYYSTLD